MSRGTGGNADLLEVRILGLPLDLWARTQEHLDGLLREFTLLAAASRQGLEQHTPIRLLDLVADLQRDYDQFTSEQGLQLVNAARSGAESIDLSYRVPRAMTTDCLRLREALDAADRYCMEGDHLLSLATPTDQRALRHWYLDEFVAQALGHPPTSWSEWCARRP